MAKSKRETVTIRVSPRTNAALNMVVGKLQASQKGRVRQDDAIWYLIQKAESEVANMVKEASPEKKDEAEG